MFPLILLLTVFLTSTAQETNLSEQQYDAVVVEPAPSDSVIIDTSIYRGTAFFAPYDGPFPISLDSRFEGFPWHHRSSSTDRSSFLSFLYSFDGYVRFPGDFFFKSGVIVGAHKDFITRVGLDLQLGKYWCGYGAFRFGAFAGGLGVGGDYWLIYRKYFKWLTTIELATFSYQRWLIGHDHKFSVKWLNRFFVFSNVYITAGIEHLHGQHGRGSSTQGFIGFGSSI